MAALLRDSSFRAYATPDRDSRPLRAPAPPVWVPVRPATPIRNVLPVRRSVRGSGQPAAGSSPPGAPSTFPPNKGKLVVAFFGKVVHDAVGGGLGVEGFAYLRGDDTVLADDFSVFEELEEDEGVGVCAERTARVLR